MLSVLNQIASRLQANCNDAKQNHTDVDSSSLIESHLCLKTINTELNHIGEESNHINAESNRICCDESRWIRSKLKCTE